MSDARHLVGKLWSTATTCAASAWGVIDYTPQLTYLLLLKMMQERATRNLARSKSRRRPSGQGPTAEKPPDMAV